MKSIGDVTLIGFAYKKRTPHNLTSLLKNSNSIKTKEFESMFYFNIKKTMIRLKLIGVNSLPISTIIIMIMMYLLGGIGIWTFLGFYLINDQNFVFADEKLRQPDFFETFKMMSLSMGLCFLIVLMIGVTVKMWSSKKIKNICLKKKERYLFEMEAVKIEQACKIINIHKKRSPKRL